MDYKSRIQSVSGFSQTKAGIIPAFPMQAKIRERRIQRRAFRREGCKRRKQ